MTKLYKEVNNCRFCHSNRLDSVLDFGQPYISDFIKPGYVETKAPLELMLCCDCGLVQLHHSVDRDRLYRSYFYQSGTNESMVLALKNVVDEVYSRVDFVRNDKVLDIGCNDGTLLSNYGLHYYPKSRVYNGVPKQRFTRLTTIGFEPCADMAAKAHEKDGVKCIFNEFFPPKINPYNTGKKKVKAITSIAMFYDIDNVDRFVHAIKRWLHEDGVWVVQLQGLDEMLRKLAFDNIVHEHLLYIDPAPFASMLRKHGLEIEDISCNNTNGGSTRYIIRHEGKCRNQPVEPVANIPSLRQDLANFSEGIAKLKLETLQFLEGVKRAGKSILGVAASTKANTYLQHFGIDPDLLPAIGDRNPDKHGLVTVGSHIPIVSEQEMLSRNPNYLLALAWHFVDSFRSRYPHYEVGANRWVTGLPKLEILQPEKVSAYRIYTVIGCKDSVVRSR